ncbi:MAG: DoxX family protein [Gemmatimonadaceae bacterium]|nr:DoxX family protein [Gemmatimonadaceae bacterium]
MLSILVFLGYGLLCLFSDGMVEEFRRYGLSQFRRLVGSLEVVGALGLMTGFVVQPITVLSATGLSVLMFFAVLVRLRVRDTVFHTLPALVLLLANLFIAGNARGWP